MFHAQMLPCRPMVIRASASESLGFTLKYVNETGKVVCTGWMVFLMNGSALLEEKAS